MEGYMKFILEIDDDSVSGSHLLTENELDNYWGIDKYKRYIKQVGKVLIIEFDIQGLVKFLEEFDATICQDDTAFIPEIYYSILLP